MKKQFDPTERDGIYRPVGKKSNCGTIAIVVIVLIAVVACVLIIAYLGGVAYIFNHWPEIWSGIKAFFAQ